jgi:hypothetical protein
MGTSVMAAEANAHLVIAWPLTRLVCDDQRRVDGNYG